MKIVSDIGRRLAWIIIQIIFLLSVMVTGISAGVSGNLSGWTIEKSANDYIINAGSLKRIIHLDGVNFTTTSMKIGSAEIFREPSSDLIFNISMAFPNREPGRIDRFDESQAIESTATFRTTDNLDLKYSTSIFNSGVEWIEPIYLNSDNWDGHFDMINPIISTPRVGVRRLTLRVRSVNSESLKDMSVSIIFEIYEGHPAIRQWVEVVNNSHVWYKLDKLILSPLPVGNTLSLIKPLTPDDKAVTASIRSFGSIDQTYGLILGSEVPSATRMLDESTGKMGYNDSYFEWILGPSNRFVSEAVSYYAFSGEVRKTLSALSTPLDRCVESNYKSFLSDYIGVMADHADLRAPRYCTWSNYAENINQETARLIIPIAARCGFNTFQFDDGWQYDRLGTEPNMEKFPDFDSICAMVAREKMTLGLWVSCYRSPDAKDLRVLHDAMSLPPVKRLSGYGMGFASEWRYYYAQDLVYLNDRYGAAYFKQDFTNIRLGDLAVSHESRTIKESYLKGLRGLLESQKLVREISPDITTLISHEIYWGTPGVPCDLAVMKNVCFYHIPPNDYSGLGPIKYRKKRVSEYDSLANTEDVRRDLLAGCWHARQQYFAHRGLPLHMLEYYGAATANVRNALTTSIQDRQICSFLMGAPVVYAGDLLSLTQENILHYRKRFDLLKELQDKFNIYRYFQYSGVPEPTEEGWHWWGKLNSDHEGAVVVLRGTGGTDKRTINIPWVSEGKKYSVKRLFTQEELGIFTGDQLQKGKIIIDLPVLGQDILFIELVAN
jgi:hypothetical protein